MHVPAADESGDIVKTRFINFLQTFASDIDFENYDNDGADQNNADHT